jgi:hypothetical protein
MATRLGFRTRPVDVNRELKIVLDEVDLDTEESVRDLTVTEKPEKVRTAAST